MEFVIKRCPPAPSVATGLGRTFVLHRTEIRDDSGTLLGRVERRKQPSVTRSSPGATDVVLCEKGVVTAVFTQVAGPTAAFWLTIDDQTYCVHPWNHFVCDEIHARTVLPWFPPGQCHYTVDDHIDPVRALFLYLMLENLENDIES